MTKCYTYNPTTKTLTPADEVVKINGQLIIHPSVEMYAEINAYPIGISAAPTPPDGKIAVPDGFTLDNGTWIRTWRFEDAPVPTIADYDATMENHLRTEREARGYTTREPDVYLNSQVPRWASDARDWIAHRDAVMLYALELMHQVEAGTREPPTLEDFRAGLPSIQWTFSD